MKKTLPRSASTKNLTPVVATVSAAFLLAAGAPGAVAAENPFNAQLLDGGYQQLADTHKSAEGKCGEAKCGAKKADKVEKVEEAKCGEAADKATEGKCGEGKCGEGICGGAAS